MANVGRLNWIMDLDSSRFDRGIRGMTRRVGRLRQAAAGAAAVIGGGAVAGVATTRADQLAKSADALGVGVNFLQNIRVASERAGVENISSNLDRLSKRLGRLNVGGGALAKFLKRKGADEVSSITGKVIRRGSQQDIRLARNLTGAGLEQSLELIADRLTNIRSAEDRSALLEAAGFGVGSRAGNLFSGGRRQFRARLQDAERTGFNLTLEQARRAERREDVKADISRFFGTGTTQVGLRLGEAGAGAAEGSAALLREIRDLIRIGNSNNEILP